MSQNISRRSPRVDRVLGLRRRRSHTPNIERLETRTTPSTLVWTGGGSNADWSDPANWGGSIPTGGSDLVFPASATKTTSIDDLSSSLTFDSITIEAPSYDISGNGFALIGGVTDTASSGVSTISNDIVLGSGVFEVDAGATLTMIGMLDSPSAGQAFNDQVMNMTVDGSGTLDLASQRGFDSIGAISVVSGVLELDQHDGQPPGFGTGNLANLTIGGGGRSAKVIALAPDQFIYESTNVIVNANGVLDLNGFDETLYTLSLDGGIVRTGSGALDLSTGDIHVSTSPVSSVISGELLLSWEPLDIYVSSDGSSNPGLVFNASVFHQVGASQNTGVGIEKQGAGSMVLSSTVALASNSGIQVFQGLLDINADLPDAMVSVDPGGEAGGSGSIGSFNAGGSAIFPGDSANAGAGALQADGISIGTPGYGTTNLSVALDSASTFGHVISLLGVYLNSAGLDVTLAAGYVPAPGTSFVVIDNQSGKAVNGIFDGLPEGAVVYPTNSGSSVGFQISYQGGVNGNDVVLTAIGAASAAKTATVTTVTSSNSSAVFGEPETLSAAVDASNSANPTGTVDFYAGTSYLGSSALVGGRAILSDFTEIPVGVDSITAVYQGNGLDDPSESASIATTVFASNTQLRLRTSIDSMSYGETATLTAVVASADPGSLIPSGSIDFYAGSTLLASIVANNGIADFTTSSLPAGSDVIHAVFVANADFNASTSNVSTIEVAQTVPGAAIYYNGEDNNLTINYGFPLDLICDVISPYNDASAPTGDIVLYDGSRELATATIENGVVVFHLDALSIGVHDFVAAYQGDANYTSASSSSFQVTVNQGYDNTDIVSSTTTAGGRSVEFTALTTAEVVGSSKIALPTGTISFYDRNVLIGYANLSAGTATIVIPDAILSPGNNPIVADYSGDSNYPPDQTFAPYNYVNIHATSIGLRLSPDETPVFGQATSLYASVSATPGDSGPASPPQGDVSFYDGARFIGLAPLSNGTAVFTTSDLAAGSRLVRAVYSGDALFASSESSPLSVYNFPNTFIQNNKNVVNVLLSSSPDRSQVGGPVDLTATVDPEGSVSQTPSGVVTFYLGSTVLGNGTLINGAASIAVRFVAAGETLPITASYGGGGEFTASTSNPLFQTVVPAPSVNSLIDRIIPFGSGYGVQLIDTVASSNPASIAPEGTVNFEEGGRPLGTARLFDGFAVFDLPYFRARGGFFQASYMGDRNFLQADSPIVHVGRIHPISYLNHKNQSRFETRGRFLSLHRFDRPRIVSRIAP
jgi:hypothetical protein